MAGFPLPAVMAGGARPGLSLSASHVAYCIWKEKLPPCHAPGRQVCAWFQRGGENPPRMLMEQQQVSVLPPPPMPWGEPAALKQAGEGWQSRELGTVVAKIATPVSGLLRQWEAPKDLCPTIMGWTCAESGSCKCMYHLLVVSCQPKSERISPHSVSSVCQVFCSALYSVPGLQSRRISFKNGLGEFLLLTGKVLPLSYA